MMVKFHIIALKNIFDGLCSKDYKSSMIVGAGDLLMLLNVSSDEKVLPTTYGELRPPLGKYRLKVGYPCNGYGFITLYSDVSTPDR